MDNQYLARIRWKARRGMKEMDILFESFISNQFNKLNNKEKLLFEHILDEEDDLLWKWLTNQQLPEDSQVLSIINKIKQRL